MSLLTDVQAHVVALKAAVETELDAAVIAYPKRYAKDELGKKLVEDYHKAVDNAALAEDFSDLDQ